MASVVQFTVDDSSPNVEYSPFGDTLSSPNLSAGWNPYWDSPGFSSATTGATGSGTSLHITSLDGASLQIQWTGTGIQLFGNVTRASYIVDVDGVAIDASTSADLSNNVLATINGLTDTNHTLLFTTQTDGPDPLVAFDKAIISAPPSPSNVSSLDFAEQVLNDTDFAFRGQWSFQNGSEPAHQSATVGDSALLQFTGTSFLLKGSTSPNAGRYSVTLDNVTTLFSGESSFTETHSLLFFASGLDAEVTHNLKIVNTQGASLVLPVGGASVFAKLKNSPPPTSSSSASNSPSSTASASSALAGGGLSSGTIAALVLAGVLIFFIALGLLLYFLLYRPYRRKRRQPQRPKEDQDAESILVVDIGPDVSLAKKAYDDSPVAGPSRDRTSKRTGFERWKEEVQGGLGNWGRGALGIAFRHSDSTGRRDWSGSSRDYDLEVISDSYKSTSSSSNGGNENWKGKGRETGRWSHRRDKSLSPRFKLGFLIEPRSRSRSGSQSNAPSNGRTDPSTISSLSYLSSPSLHPTTLPSHTSPPSPSAPEPTPNTHSRRDSGGALLVHGDVPPPEVDDGYIPRPLPPPTASLPPPPAPAPTSPPEPLRQDDQGSVREYDIDDGRSILGDGSARIALRSLSPRTSEAEHRKARSKRRAAKKRMAPSPLSNATTEDAAPAGGSNIRDTVDTSLFLRSTSPFQVDFDQNDPRAPRLSTQSRVRFEGDVGAEGTEQTQGVDDKGKGSAATNENRGPTSKAPFRLTPPSEHLHNASFLDFASSSEGSMMTRSNEYSSSSQRTRSSLRSQAFTGHSRWSTGGSSSNMASIVPPPQPKSRWSATTAPSSEVHHDASNGSGSSDANFPFPVSLPASPHHPEGTFTQDPSSFGPHLEMPTQPSSLSSLNYHPTDLSSNAASPTDSVPMSVSDIHFRHSDPDETNGSHAHTSGGSLPSHPPLPASPGQGDEGRSTPPYIVQRVLGIHSPSLSLGGSTLLTPTPTATRTAFNTSSSPGSSRPSPGSSGHDA